MVEAVSAQLPLGEHDALQRQCLQPRLHVGLPRQHARHRVRAALEVGQLLEQQHHATALRHERRATLHVPAHTIEQRAIGGETRRMQLRIAARQIQRIGRRHCFVVQRRKERERRPHGTQQIEVGRIDERERRILRHRDVHAGEQRGRALGGGRRKAHAGNRLQRHARADFLGSAIESCLQIGDLGGLDQSQVSLREGHRRIARQCAEEAQVRRGPGETRREHGRVAGPTDTVGQYAEHRQFRSIGTQPQGNRTKRAGHGRGIDDQQQRQIEFQCQISAGGISVMQPHHAFDQQQVGLLRRLAKELAAMLPPAHPQIELLHRLSRGAREQHRIDEIRAGLEHPHPLAAASDVTRDRRGHRGLALA